MKESLSTKALAVRCLTAPFSKHTILLGTGVRALLLWDTSGGDRTGGCHVGIWGWVCSPTTPRVVPWPVTHRDGRVEEESVMTVLDMSRTSNTLTEDVLTFSLRKVSIFLALYSLALLLWCWQGGHAGIAAGYMPVPVTGLQLLIEHTIPITVLEIAYPIIALAVGVLTAALTKESIFSRKTDMSTTKL